MRPSRPLCRPLLGPPAQSEAHTFDAGEPTFGFTSFAPRDQVLGPASALLHADRSLLLRAACVPALLTPRG